MKILKKIFKWLSNFLIVSLVLICLYAIIASLILKKEYVNLFGYTFFVVASGSMEDTININDIIIIKINDTYEVNDIITYNDNGYFITHRVISISENEIVAKGDANNTTDEVISKDLVIGRVVYYFPLISIFRILGAIILIVIIILVFNFQDFFKKYLIKKSKKKISEDKVENKLIISQFVEIFNQRKRIKKEKDSEKTMIQLRYLTKTIELVDIKEFNLLEQLLKNYSFKNLKEGIVSKELLLGLSKESLKTDITLLLKAITYEDNEMFDIIFYCYKKKLIKKYIKK